MTSAPERRRSLGIRWRELYKVLREHNRQGDVLCSNYDGWIWSESQVGEVFVGQVKGYSLLKISGDLVQRAALSDDRDLDAFRHVSRLLARSDHRFDRVLEHRRSPSHSSIAPV